MRIHADLVNNELLSTIVIAYLICSIIHIFVKTIANFGADLIEYLYEKHKKKKTSC